MTPSLHLKIKILSNRAVVYLKNARAFKIIQLKLLLLFIYIPDDEIYFMNKNHFNRCDSW